MQMQHYSTPSSKINDEHEAAVALHALQAISSYSRHLPPSTIPPSTIPLSTMPHMIQTMPQTVLKPTKRVEFRRVSPQSSTTKKILLPLLALGLTMATIWGVFKCVQMFFLPLVYAILGHFQIFLFGEEDGVHCKVWSNSPLQQLRCTALSFTNGYFISLVNDWTRELLTKRWDALPTCFAYLFTTCGALYLQYIYVIRRIVSRLFSIIVSMYRVYYLALDNPMMPFDYIEQSMLMVE